MGTEPRLRIVPLLLPAHPQGLVAGDMQEALGIPNSTVSHHQIRGVPLFVVAQFAGSKSRQQYSFADEIAGLPYTAKNVVLPQQRELIRGRSSRRGTN
jgi:hypothetical protein